MEGVVVQEFHGTTEVPELFGGPWSVIQRAGLFTQSGRGEVYRPRADHKAAQTEAKFLNFGNRCELLWMCKWFN